MSRIGPIAFLILLTSAAAASACCFFKCCSKYGPAGAVSPGEDPSKLSPHTLAAATLRITSVDAEAPNTSNNITHDIDSTRSVQVIVESNFDPSASNPELTVTDQGPRSLGPTPAPTVTARPTKKYRPTRIQEKPSPKGSTPAPTTPAPGPPPSRIWQTFYTIPASDLLPGHNYSVYATAGSVTSSTVTFHTR